MTTQEFMQRRNRYLKAVAGPALVEIALVVVPPLVLMDLTSWHQRLPVGPWIGLFLLVYVAIWGAGMFFFARHVERTATALGLPCPQCQTLLLGMGAAKHALASGRCVRCGAPVLDCTV